MKERIQNFINTNDHFIFLFIVIAVVLGLSGCGVLGVREAELWDGGPRMVFAAGSDFHVGANSIDNVMDSRGINPEMKDTRKVAVKQAKY